MVKYHKYISLLIGLLYLIVLQSFSAPQPVFRFLVFYFLLYCIGVFFYNRWYLKQIQKYNLWVVVRSVLLPVSALGIFFFIPSLGMRGLFLTVTVALIALSEYYLENFSENLTLAQTLLIAFGFFFFFAGVSWNFPPYAFAATVVLFFVIWLLSRSFYESVPRPERVKSAIALLLALFCSELFWALTFLPFHFSVLALLLFNIFYLCLILNYYYLFHTLTFKKIQFHLVLMLACDLIAIVSTPWAILSK